LLFLFYYLAWHLTDLNLSESITEIYSRSPFNKFGQYGIRKTTTFSIRWWPSEDLSWFGPLSFLLAVPSVLTAMLKRRLRLLAFTGLFVVILISWQIYWMPYNSRFFTLGWVILGPCIAYFFANYLRSKWIRRPAVAVCLLIALYAATFNYLKPLVYPSNTWIKTDWGRNRLYPSERHFGDDRVKKIARLLPDGARVGLVFGRNSWLFPYLVHIRHVQWKNISRFESDRISRALTSSASDLDLTHLLLSRRGALQDSLSADGRLEVLASRRDGRFPYALYTRR
jgi:hypothetical protein